MKKILRKEAIEKREAMHDIEWIKGSKDACKKILKLKEYKNASCVFGYMSKGYELDIKEVLIDAINRGKKVVLPKIIGSEIVPIESDLENLKVGKFDILEPSGNIKVPPYEISLFLVPGVLFDVKKNRLGYGRGYVDRLLSKSKGIKIGICHEWQVKNELPSTHQDVPMDIIVTEKRVLK